MDAPSAQPTDGNDNFSTSSSNGGGITINTGEGVKDIAGTGASSTIPAAEGELKPESEVGRDAQTGAAKHKEKVNASKKVKEMEQMEDAEVNEEVNEQLAYDILTLFAAMVRHLQDRPAGPQMAISIRELRRCKSELELLSEDEDWKEQYELTEEEIKGPMSDFQIEEKTRLLSVLVTVLGKVIAVELDEIPTIILKAQRIGWTKAKNVIVTAWLNNRSFISDDEADEPIQMVLDEWQQKDFNTFRKRICGEFERLVKENRIQIVLPTDDTVAYHDKHYKPAVGMVGTLLRHERGGDGLDRKKQKKWNLSKETKKQYEARKSASGLAKQNPGFVRVIIDNQQHLSVDMYEKLLLAMSTRINTYLERHPNAGLIFDGEEIGEGERITRQLELTQLLKDAANSSGTDLASRLLHSLSTQPKNLFLAFNLCKGIYDGDSLEITVDGCAAVKEAALELGDFLMMAKSKREVIQNVQIMGPRNPGGQPAGTIRRYVDENKRKQYKLIAA